MNETEIMKGINTIQSICEQIAETSERAQQQGRMPTLMEAQQLDEFSRILMEEIRSLPENAKERVGNPAHCLQVERVLNFAQKVIAAIVQPTHLLPPNTLSAPRATFRQLNAYKNY